MADATAHITRRLNELYWEIVWPELVNQEDEDMPLFNIRHSPYSYVGGGQIVGKDNRPVAYLAGRMNDGNAPAVGNVLAAAADLYNALKAITDCYGVGSTPEQFCEHVREFMLEGRAALAKARGET